MSDREAPTQEYYGAIVAPLALGPIVSTPSLAAGAYRITVLVSYGAVGDLVDNMQLVLPAGATPAGPLRLKVPGLLNAQAQEQVFTIDLLSGGVISVQAVAAGAVGAVYTASLLVEPL